ncbi:biotin transporter BioY [Halogranum rubrum]|uniref:BioY protein n=1 Tax=Halogranum salarium B-1 TaxID=1210908 RepID=J3EX81_9EURY|nr:biotin transporter BioY [Halogranum salarium]EJN59652.1 BioY protein [Halogranum salarium B-1]
MATSNDSVELVGDEAVVNLARAVLFAALMGAFAFVSFPNPLSPAPITLQVLGVFLAGIMLGPVWGPAAMLLYLVAGAVGAPVFAGGASGLGVLLAEPTLGYLWSYPVAAAAVGLGVHGGSLGDYRDTSVPVLVAAMVVGTVIIYALGIAGLMAVLGLSFVEAFTAGAAVFLPAEAFKIAAAVGIVRSDAIAAT